MNNTRHEDCDPFEALEALEALNEHLEREEALRRGTDPDCLEDEEPLSVPDGLAEADRQDQIERNAILNDPGRCPERS